MPPISLQRSLFGRIFGGSRLQGFLALIEAIVAVVTVVRLAGGGGDGGLSPVAGVVVLVVLAAVLAVGASGHAEADDAGVRWRYYGAHSYSWDEIEAVELRFVSTGIAGYRQPLVVRARGRNHTITPASGAGPGRKEFGRALLAAAHARGIAGRDGWA